MTSVGARSGFEPQGGVGERRVAGDPLVVRRRASRWRRTAARSRATRRRPGIRVRRRRAGCAGVCPVSHAIQFSDSASLTQPAAASWRSSRVRGPISGSRAAAPTSNGRTTSVTWARASDRATRAQSARTRRAATPGAVASTRWSCSEKYAVVSTRRVCRPARTDRPAGLRYSHSSSDCRKLVTIVAIATISAKLATMPASPIAAKDGACASRVVAQQPRDAARSRGSTRPQAH